MPLPTPSMAGPLATAIPHEVPAGPFGKIEITGILSGIGMIEDNPVFHGDGGTWTSATLRSSSKRPPAGFNSTCKVALTTYRALGVPFAKTGATTTGLYGPFPMGYVKLVKGNFNVEIGELPTLVGAEYTFNFENMNIERGLLWNQEQAISRGIQLNETYKKLTLAFSWNDSYYSDRYTRCRGRWPMPSMPRTRSPL